MYTRAIVKGTEKKREKDLRRITGKDIKAALHTSLPIIVTFLVLAVLATRIVPVLIFGRGEKVPEFILYLGRVVPYTAMGLLIVYCLRDVPVFDAPHGLPELIALAVVAVSYIWKRNTIFSVVIGTALYMFLVQSVF